MHLAAAAGAPTLHLFGPTDPAEYAPSGLRARAVISASTRMEDLSIERTLTTAVRPLAQDPAILPRAALCRATIE
jgi:heptosyltransferase III